MANYIASDDKAFEIVNYGFELDLEEQQRRYILLSLLSDQGLDLLSYRDRFFTDALTDFPELQHLHELKLIKQNSQRLYLTDLGLERSDAVGPSLFSSAVQALMQEYEITGQCEVFCPMPEIAIKKNIPDAYEHGMSETG